MQTIRKRAQWRGGPVEETYPLRSPALTAFHARSGPKPVSGGLMEMRGIGASRIFGARSVLFGCKGDSFSSILVNKNRGASLHLDPSHIGHGCCFVLLLHVFLSRYSLYFLSGGGMNIKLAAPPSAPSMARLVALRLRPYVPHDLLVSVLRCCLLSPVY